MEPHSVEQRARLEIARQIYEMFHLERMANLVLNSVAGALLVVAAAFIVHDKAADLKNLSLVCGSGGLLGVTSGRLLKMWADVMRVVFGRQ
jgi:hypothetical protein